jgi:ketosteroid isomerase-like protein
MSKHKTRNIKHKTPGVCTTVKSATGEKEVFLVSLEWTVATFFEVFNTRDMDGMAELLHENAELYFPKTRPLIGKKRILKFLNILFRQYPELAFEVQRIICQGDNAAVHWTNAGRSRRHEPYQNEGVTILEMAAGKIHFISDFFKDTEKF